MPFAPFQVDQTIGIINNMNNSKSFFIAILIHLLVALLINFSYSNKNINHEIISLNNLITVNLDSLSLSSIQQRPKLNAASNNTYSPAYKNSPAPLVADKSDAISKTSEINFAKENVDIDSSANNSNLSAQSRSGGFLDGDNEGVFNESISEYKKPIYPRIAIKQNLEGAVKVEAFVNSSGKIVDVKILASSGHKILDDAAVNAVYSWTLKPANTSFSFTKTIRFKLN